MLPIIKKTVPRSSWFREKNFRPYLSKFFKVTLFPEKVVPRLPGRKTNLRDSGLTPQLFEPIQIGCVFPQNLRRRLTILWPPETPDWNRVPAGIYFRNFGKLLSPKCEFSLPIHKEARTIDDESLGRLITCKGAWWAFGFGLKVAECSFTDIQVGRPHLERTK